MELAIVIPAYKPNFIRETLKSIASQTDKRFTVYIGDDASPHDLKGIVEEFKNALNIVYKRFDTNLGSISLVKHWDRCIELINGEEWIWLFSDDDVMDTSCVSNFYKTLEVTNKYYDLYKFNVTIIKDDNSVKEIAPVQSGIISSLDFLKMKVSGKIYTFAIDYIFRTSVYKRTGFVDFPLAWCSDDATWSLLGKNTGIFVIPDSRVYWRTGNYNISGDKLKHFKKKEEALLSFMSFIKLNFGKAKDIDIHYLHDQKNYFLANIDEYKYSMHAIHMLKTARRMSEIWEDSFFHNIKLLLLRHPFIKKIRS